MKFFVNCVLFSLVMGLVSVKMKQNVIIGEMRARLIPHAHNDRNVVYRLV